MTKDSLKLTQLEIKDEKIQNLFNKIKELSLAVSKAFCKNIEININTNLNKDVCKIKFSLNL